MHAQQAGIPATSFSHIYFVIDSAGYSALSQNKFCTDTLFYYSSGAVNTDQGSWDGQYFEGEVDYLEVFKPDTIAHMSAGDIGLGFMLHQPYSSDAFRKYWQSLTNDSIHAEAFTYNAGKDTMMVEVMNYRDSMLTGGPSSFFALFYHPSVLKKAGFTEKDIHAGINQQMINQRSQASASYKRLFKKTEKIYLQLTPHEFERHKTALKAMDYKEIYNRHFKKDIDIFIELNTKVVTRLKKIEFSLTKKVEPKTHIISTNLLIAVDGEKGELVLK